MRPPASQVAPAKVAAGDPGNRMFWYPARPRAAICGVIRYSRSSKALTCVLRLVKEALKLVASTVARESTRSKSRPVATVRVPSLRTPKVRLDDVGVGATTVVLPP